MTRRAAEEEGSRMRVRRTLSPAARAASAGFATLLRAFGDGASAQRDGGDRLWTAEPVALERVPAVDGLPSPELVSGPLERLAATPGEALVAWGETGSVARLRAQAGAASPRDDRPDWPGWLGTLRTLPPAAPEIAARVNDRRFCLELARRLGRSLPGARTVRSVEELAGHLRSGACAVAGGAWVAKAPWSAAGRHRVIGTGTDADSLRDDGPLRRRLERLLERSGALVVEPWVPRRADFGAVGLVLADVRVEALGAHRLEVDRRGAFTGLVLERLDPAEEAALEETLDQVGRGLAGAGYVGPFGIDGFTWTDPAGASHVHPLSEINARSTFGLIARALVARTALRAGAERPGAVALRFGRRTGAEGRDGGRTVRSIELLAATESAPGAWLEVG